MITFGLWETLHSCFTWLADEQVHISKSGIDTPKPSTVEFVGFWVNVSSSCTWKSSFPGVMSLEHYNVSILFEDLLLLPLIICSCV